MKNATRMKVLAFIAKEQAAGKPITMARIHRDIDFKSKAISQVRFHLNALNDIGAIQCAVPQEGRNSKEILSVTILPLGTELLKAQGIEA